ncbi:MAG TPA: hypothetical protein PLF22_00565 [Pseudomonadales bacterium]|nr:hypothetical protein [Pseudomonadales bacterium]
MNQRTMTDLLDHMIPQTIWRTTPTQQMIVRARTLTAVLIFSMAIPSLALMAVIALQVVTDKSFYAAIASLVASIAVVTMQHIRFQSSANLQMTARLFSFTFFLALTIATFLTGGWHSPVVLLLFCTPIIVHLISDSREAVWAVLGTFLTGVIFLELDVMDVALPHIMHEENRAYVQGIVWLVAFLIQLLLFGTQAWALEAHDYQNHHDISSGNTTPDKKP